MELGASIIADANKILKTAAKRFGLNTTSPQTNDHASFGVYDGSWRLLAKPYESGWLGWLPFAKMAYRYGIQSLFQTKSMASDLAKRFEAVYDLMDQKQLGSIDELVKALGFEDETQHTCQEWMSKNKISPKFVEEMLGGITRNTYLQETENIHAFGCLLALYSGQNDMFSIEGGNYLLFEKMLQQRTVHLNTRVESVERLSNGRFLLKTGESEQLFDYVVLAAPAGIDLINIRKPPRVKYVKLHVTLALGVLDPSYFGLKADQEIPSMILTPSPSKTPFHSFGLRQVNATHTIVKMFSQQPVDDLVLNEMHRSPPQVWRHFWNAPGSYPFIGPLPETFESRVQLEERFYYPSAMERFFSCLEVQAISGLNVANMIKAEMGYVYSGGFPIMIVALLSLFLSIGSAGTSARGCSGSNCTTIESWLL
ncbi:Prenylcysteine lyase-domain-containing protein [Gorgonomyces haynaldii]|nr:Prenylcysteine lyase-domain-containing protein [Gorgonomyces haynaldii]